jgi:hypothetical protein
VFWDWPDGDRVFLTYLDDGGKGPVKIFGGIVVPHDRYGVLELMSAFIARDLIPSEKLELFEEFHASDLFVGSGVFAGIPEPKRHGALRELILLRNHFGITYVYSAVDTNELNKSPMRSASWIDSAFFMVACAIDELITGEHRDVMRALGASKVAPQSIPRSPLILMIVDEPGQQADKNRIRSSYRSIRRPLAHALEPTGRVPAEFRLSNRLSAPVDQVLFGNSADSIGLQIADACNWVMWRHLTGEEDEFFEELNKGRNICAKPEPEWTRYRHLFRAHD